MVDRDGPDLAEAVFRNSEYIEHCLSDQMPTVLRQGFGGLLQQGGAGALAFSLLIVSRYWNRLAFNRAQG